MACRISLHTGKIADRILPVFFLIQIISDVYSNTHSAAHSELFFTLTINWSFILLFPFGLSNS